METRRALTIMFMALCPMVLWAGVTKAELTGNAFTYQGRLIDNNDVADGLYDFQFKLFDNETVGSKLGPDVNAWEVDVIDGYFTVELDFGSVFDGNALWLEIGVRPGELEDPNVYTVLSPRQEVTPTPYALYALNGGAAGGAIWQMNGSDIYYNNGNVGIGTASPSEELEIAEGTIKATNSHLSDIAVHGAATNTESGSNYGGYFEAAGSSGRGVYGYASGSTGRGVYGRASSSGDSTNFGGYFSASGRYGRGVYGEAAGEFGRGVYGFASDSSGTNYAIYGKTYSPSGYAGYFEGGRNYFEGNIGIGMTSPTEALEVSGTVKADAFVGDGSSLTNLSTDSDWVISGDDIYSGVSGRVGIGTDSPGRKLTAVGVIRVSSGAGQSHSVEIAHGGSNGYINWFGNGNLDFRYNDSTLMLLTQAGNVGIGTTNPDEKLTVDHGTIKATTYVSSGKAIYGVATATGDSTNYGGYFVAAGDSGRGVVGSASGYSGAGVYGTSSGYNGYGVAAVAWGDTGTAVYGEASGSSFHRGVWGNASGTYGYGVYGSGGDYDFFAGGPGTNYGSPSSIRWKENIQQIDDPLGKLLQLRGIYFDWDAEHGGKHDVGMVAEEVGKVLPEIVEYEEDGIYTSGMDYSKLTPLLIEAVKALKTENDELKQRIAALEADVRGNRGGDKK